MGKERKPNFFASAVPSCRASLCSSSFYSSLFMTFQFQLHCSRPIRDFLFISLQCDSSLCSPPYKNNAQYYLWIRTTIHMKHAPKCIQYTLLHLQCTQPTMHSFMQKTILMLFFRNHSVFLHGLPQVRGKTPHSVFTQNHYFSPCYNYPSNMYYCI